MKARRRQYRFLPGHQCQNSCIVAMSRLQASSSIQCAEFIIAVIQLFHQACESIWAPPAACIYAMLFAHLRILLSPLTGRTIKACVLCETLHIALLELTIAVS